MTGVNGNTTLVLCGFKFSKLQNRKKGILVTSVDPEDNTKSVVVSSKEGAEINETELDNKAVLFCRLVNKLLQKQKSPCFVAYEVIYKMVASGLSNNRAEALNLGKELSKKLRLFYRVEYKRNTFSDDGKIYKFRPEVLLSVIMKSPMSIQKLTPLDHDRKNKTERIVESEFSAMKFRKFAPKKNLPESKEEEKEQEITTVEKNRFTGKPKKKGRRPKGKDSVKVVDQTHMIPHDVSPVSEKDWGKPRQQHRGTYGHRETMESIREMAESSIDDDRSIYTEVTLSEHDQNHNGAFYPRAPSQSQYEYEEDEASYMELTVSTAGGGDNSTMRETHSYFDDYTLDDDDEYDFMSVPTTPVVKEKIKVKAKASGANDFFSPNDVMGFDTRVAPGSQRSAKANRETSLSSRMRRGLDIDIEIPY